MPIYGFNETKSKFPVLDKATYDPANKSGQIAVINDIKPVVLTDDATVNPLIPTLYVMNAASKTITLGTNVNAGIEVTVFAKIATTVSYIVNGATVTDSLSVDDTIGYIFNGLNWTRKNKTVFSTNEVKTGDYWIDGKPIYRRVLQGQLVLNSSTKSLSVDISSWGINYIIKVDYTLKQTGGGTNNLVFGGSYNSSTIYSTSYYTVNNTSIYFVYGSAYAAGDTVTAIIEYTKTTD